MGVSGNRVHEQARNQGGRSPLEKFLPSLEKCAGHNLKLLDTVQKLGPLSEHSSPFLVSQAGYGPVHEFKCLSK